MDSGGRMGRARELRSGGKIVRARRAAGARTPYDRPGSQNSVQRNPNWISRFIYSPSRTIASSAGKLITSVFVSDSSSSSSSGSSANASDAELDDEDEVSNSSAADEPLDKIGTPEMINSAKNDPPPVFWRKETKRIIEQLILQETFSREECDRLTTVIKSRVVDLPNAEDGKDGRQNEFPDDVGMPELSSKAIREARKWLDEKKSSNFNAKLDHGSYTPDSSMLPRATVYEVGSPVYLAKSYMRTRPAWTSPSADPIELRSPNDSFFSGGCVSLSSSKLKLGAPSTRSWNLQEEMRKVRSKATEDMLKNLSSSMFDGSPFSSEPKNNEDRLVNDQLEAGKENQMYGVDTCLETDAEASTSFQVPNGLQNLQNEALANPISPSSKCNQDMASDKTNEVTMEDFPTKAGDAVAFALKVTPQDSVPYNGNHSTSNEVTGTGLVVISNGLPSSEPSLSARFEPEREPETEPEPEPEPRLISEEIHLMNQGHEIASDFKHAEGNCVLLRQSSLEKTIVNEHDTVMHNSTSLPLDVSEDNDTRPVEKEVMNKTRRGRGRGRLRGKSRGK